MTAEYIARYDKAVVDFTGEWELAHEMSQFGFLKPPQRRIDRIAQTPERLTVETRQVDTRGDNTVTREIPLDGNEATTDVLGRPSTYRATWNHDRLVIEGTWLHAGQERGANETWYLEGSKIIIDRVMRMPGGDVRQHLVLRRRAHQTPDRPLASK